MYTSSVTIGVGLRIVNTFVFGPENVWDYEITVCSWSPYMLLPPV